MEYKLFKIDVEKFDAENRLMAGYASTFGMPADHQGDVIVKGAFSESILKIKNGGIPLLDTHNSTCSDVLGTVIDAFEDDHGLYITAKLADTPMVEECRQKMLQGHLNKMSIGFFTVKQSFKEHNGEEIRFIEQADLMEISVVAIPANPKAIIVSVKNKDIEPNTEEKQEAEAGTIDVTEGKATVEEKEEVSNVEAKALEQIAKLLMQSVNNTRRKYNGK